MRVVVMLLSLGCLFVASDVQAQNAAVTGAYRLVAVEGVPVPAVRPGYVSGEGTSVTSGVLLLRADRRFSSTIVFAVTDSGTMVDTLAISGSWRRVNNAIHLRSGASSTRDGVRSGDEIAAQLSGRRLTIPVWTIAGNRTPFKFGLLSFCREDRRGLTPVAADKVADRPCAG
jgi:hypothetical protein